MASYTAWEKDGYHVIKTKVSNIKPQVISKSVLDTNYYGINGTFWATPESGVCIHYTKFPTSSNPNQTVNISDDDSKPVRRGTFFVYKDTDLKTKCGIIDAEDMEDLKNQLPNDIDILYAIGGGNLLLGASESYYLQKREAEELHINYDGPTGRSALGFKVENGVWYAYLVVREAWFGSAGGVSVSAIRKFMKDKLDCYNAINLDGSGSAQMQCSEYRLNGDGRSVWNMVRLINK